MLQYESSSQEEKDRAEKLRLIGLIMEAYLRQQPHKEESWYVEKFDQLYDKQLVELRTLEALFKNT